MVTKLANEPLVVRPVMESFTALQLEELGTYLEAVHDSTFSVPVNEPRNLFLDSTGRLVDGGYQLSLLAMRQLCQLLAPGLWNLFSSIGGIPTLPGAEPPTSKPIAIQLFNDIVALRFRMQRGPLGKQLVKNATTRVVDGIVGHSYRFLPHHHLLAAATDVLQSSEYSATFHSAQVMGRGLSLAYLSNDSAMTFWVGQTKFRAGCYFANSEAGEIGVYATPLIQVEDTELRCMARLQHLRHVGKEFWQQLSEMLQKVMLDAAGVVAIEKAANACLTAPLAVLKNKRVDAVRRRHVQGVLMRAGVHKQAAQRMLYDAIYRGASGVAIPAKITAEELATRTVFDLFARILRHAEDQEPRKRERLERVGYGILTGKITI